MTYESAELVDSLIAPGVSYLIAKMSFSRRMDLMRRVRELARRAEFLEAGQDAAEKMDAAILRGEIDRLYLAWGLREVIGLDVDGKTATAESLADCGPEELFREALGAVRAATGLTEVERKN
jgi:hypothetical protein